MVQYITVHSPIRQRIRYSELARARLSKPEAYSVLSISTIFATSVKHFSFFNLYLPVGNHQSKRSHSINRNTRCAHDVFEALRGLPNLRYLQIVLAPHAYELDAIEWG